MSSWDKSIDIVTVLPAGRSRIRFSGVPGCSIFKNVHTSSGVHPASYFLFTEVIFPGVKLSGIFHSPSSRAEAKKKECNYTIPIQYALMGCIGTNSWDEPFQFFFCGAIIHFATKSGTSFTFSPDGSVMQYVVNLVGNYVTSQTWISFIKVFYLPTDAQQSCCERILKFALKQLLHVSVQSPLSGSVYSIILALLKL